MIRTALVSAFLAAAFLTAPSLAQPRDNSAVVKAQEEAMRKLDFLVGRWEGEATFTLPGGRKESIRQSENVQPRIGGKVLLIEGAGRTTAGEQPGKLVFEALATVSYDPAKKEYMMRAHGPEGLSVDPAFTVEDRAIRWGFSPAPSVEIRYDIRIDERGHWVETGDRSIDGGQTWTRFIELDLERLSDGIPEPGR